MFNLRHANSHYVPARFDLTGGQIKKVLAGHKIRLAHHQIGKKGKHLLCLHPENHKKVSAAYAKGKGCDLNVSDGELMHTAHSGMGGAGVWDSIKDFFKKHGSTILDGIAGAAKAIIPGSDKVVDAVRGVVKTTTGYGVGKKKSKKRSKKYESSSSESSSESEDERPKRKGKKRMKGKGLYL